MIAMDRSISRRELLKAGSAWGAAIGVPYLVPAHIL
jgi:hypothetical protein